MNYVYKLDSNDKGARQIKTEAMRNMGQLSYSLHFLRYLMDSYHPFTVKFSTPVHSSGTPCTMWVAQRVR